MNRRRSFHTTIATVIVSAVSWTGTASAAGPATPPVSLSVCQTTARVEALRMEQLHTIFVGSCLQVISTQLLILNQPLATAAKNAAPACVANFRRINDSRSLGASTHEILTKNVTRRCEPGQPLVTHQLNDVTGKAAGLVSQQINTKDIDTWCANFGGDGSIDTVPEWINCLSTAAECAANEALSTEYPRLLEWLALVRPAMLALPVSTKDPTRITDAVAALDVVSAAIDGPDLDGKPSITCGIKSTGTAVVGDVLSGQTFSNASAVGLTGTMPNNGALTYTPRTTNQSIPAGYHNGSGRVLGDAALVTGNIRSGAIIFGVAGSPSVVDTSTATATAGEMLSGATAFVNGSLVTGSLLAGTNVNGPDGSKTFTIPDGLYAGSKTATANDANLLSANIKSGVTIFGVAGALACGNGVLDAGEQCDQNNLNGQTCATLGFLGGTLMCSGGCAFDSSRCYTAPRFADNGDGTIADKQTGLMWEKKDASGGIHDRANLYTWTDTTTPTSLPTGTAYTAFLPALNANSGFANHTNWRLPTLEELQGLVDYTDATSPMTNVAFDSGCAASCTVTTCSCTGAGFYWSSSSVAANTGAAWIVTFSAGDVNFDMKDAGYFVRAVRNL